MKLPEHLKIFIFGSAVTITGNVVVGLVNYLVRRTLALNLSSSDYGSFCGTFALISILLAVFDFGLTDAGSVLVAEEKSRRSESFSAVFRLKGLAGLACGLGIFLGRDWISERYLAGHGSWMLMIFAVYVIFQSLDGALMAYYNGSKQFRLQNIFNTFKALTLLLSAWCFAGIWAAAGAALAYAVTAALFIPLQLWWISRRDKLSFHWQLEEGIRKRLQSVIAVVAGITFMQTVLFNLDSVMLTALKGTEVTAIYNVALPITQLLLAVLVFATVFLPLAVEMVNQKDFHRLCRYVWWAIGITLSAIPVVFITMHLAGEWLITLLFKSTYAGSAAPVLPYLTTGYLLFALGAFVSRILVAMRAVKFLAALAFLIIGTDFLLNYVMISRYGLIGAALATAISYLIFAVSMLIAFFRLVKSRETDGGKLPECIGED